MKAIENFCGQKHGYSRSITLRNRLIPIGKTQENLDKLNILESDKKRADTYQEVKDLIDDFHRHFIQDVLSDCDLDWGPLYDRFDLYQSKADKTDKSKIQPDLKKRQEVMRNSIVKKFTSDERYKKLFAKELLSDLLPEIIKNADSNTISDKEAALKVFDKFSTYFTGFHENRKNMYSAEEKSTAISYRIVNENFPKFYSNIKLFEKLEKEFPQIIEDTEKSLSSLLNGKRLKDIFNLEAFNKVLTQTGIKFYNTVIGGVAGEAGTEKIQGLNEKINLARQQLPATEQHKLRGKMVVLFKQILSDRETASFIPTGFESNEEVYKSIKDFKTEILDESVNIIKETFVENNEYDISKIFIPAKSLTAFSQSIFGHWSILSEGLFAIEEKKAKKALSENQVEKLTKEIAKKDYSLSDLQLAYEKYCEKYELEIKLNVKTYFSLLEMQQIEGHNEKDYINLLSRLNTTYVAIYFENPAKLQQEKEAATPIKNFLDEVQNLYHYLKLADYRGEEEKDTAFYSKLDEILSKLEEIVPLYNKVRNFVTKKVGEVKKFKLNFDCPTLANGWDENKESANDAIILRKNGNYYLGIFNPKDKPKFSKDVISDSDYYEKMVYKLLPGPNKMLPKVFFSTKGQETFLPPKDLLLSYEEGKHKKGENFDKEFMRKLIDWDKDALNRHEDWKNFNFKFSPTESYEDMSGFYKEVELQGYKLSFKKVASKTIDDYINTGKLFLFQIYNKDFAEKSTGKKNLHTLYWGNLFSEENLKDVCLKLNGEAELFYRPANKDLKVIKHVKGSILVNRTTFDGQTIPEELYQEIYQFKNNMIKSISDKAKEYLDSGKVLFKEATHDITKDRHFTQDTYLFHCPITMNFKAPEITGRKFNDRVLEALKENPNVKIIGLDRGERHLIYLSLINQKGEIELQKTLNLVEQVRNDKKVSVNYQEKLVQKEGDRDKARKNWQTIGNIKELKEGYLSNIIHEIAKLMVENNAIVVMEDLNFGFKRGRFAVERQVYQKFENMLIEKLNYLVFKDRAVTEPGGVLNAYQLTDKSANVSDVYKQCGWLFYIPAAYTSKIDPKTGFANLFQLNGLTNITKKKEFFKSFNSINYNASMDCFVFDFTYGDNADYKKNWKVYTKGERIIFNSKKKETYSYSPTEGLKQAFKLVGIEYESECNLIESICNLDPQKCSIPLCEEKSFNFFDTLYKCFKDTLQMRNSIPNSEIDYLISPVMAEDGTFFDSREQLALGKDAKLPVDADANGAYHIALKGLFLLQNDFNRDEKGKIQTITNAQWFQFIQRKDYLK